MELSVTLSRPYPSRNTTSRQTAFLPGYELSWETTAYAFNDATRYTGTYHDGTAYSNTLAALGGRLLCMKNALVASGWTVDQSSTTTHVLAGDLWTNAPDIERGTGHWIVLRSPDGVSQLVIQKDYASLSRSFYFFWSPGGLFTTGTIPATRPTATDEVAPGNGSSPSVGCIYDYGVGIATGAFYACKGTRGTEVTSRVFMIENQASFGKIQYMFCIERFVTDIPDSIYPRNVCVLAFNTGYTKNFWDKSGIISGTDYVRATMPDGRTARPSAQSAPGDGSRVWVSEFSGSLDSKSRMYPVYLSEATGTTRQFFGYIPDMFFGNNENPLLSWYGYRTFGSIWSRYAELCIPYFATDYATNLGDSDAYTTVVATANDLAADPTPPTFAGITGAEVLDNNTVRISWDSGFDNVSLHETLVYEIHYSTSPEATFETRGEVVGTITHDVTLLKPGTKYYFRVRCRDEAGNVDSNSVELSATTTGAIDATPPSVTIESPTPGTRIASSATIVARVQDSGGVRAATVFVYYPSRPDLPWEVVYNSRGFEPTQYSTCTRVELSEDTDYRYNIRRNGGWPAPPELHFDPVDTSGNNIT